VREEERERVIKREKETSARDGIAWSDRTVNSTIVRRRLAFLLPTSHPLLLPFPSSVRHRPHFLS